VVYDKHCKSIEKNIYLCSAFVVEMCAKTMGISIISAVDAALGIGYGNRLLACIAEDMEHFKNLTLGGAVIMGRRTFEGIGGALPCRSNIVLSHTLKKSAGVAVAGSMEEALRMCGGCKIFIIGGASVYAQAMSIADVLYITKIYAKFAADAFFPAIDEAQWDIIDSKHYERGKDFEYPFDFLTYERHK
jgi:dihydrofolate reductase